MEPVLGATLANGTAAGGCGGLYTSTGDSAGLHPVRYNLGIAVSIWVPTGEVWQQANARVALRAEVD